MNDIIIQTIGFIGVLWYVISYQAKSNKALFIWQMIGSATFILQMYLLGGISGCFGLVLIVVRNLLLSREEKWAWVRSWWLAAAIILASGVSTYLSWNGWISILPWLAVAASTVCYWTFNARNIRLSNLLVASPAWIIYDIKVWTIAGILSESFTMLSILVSIYRYGWKSLGENNFEKK
ncbi:MAG: YgjV family protein [Clostridiales bacterium]|nr:YgjV family protein [Candidatus Crickella merdequi]